jgi:hypothetical protein
MLARFSFQFSGVGNSNPQLTSDIVAVAIGRTEVVFVSDGGFMATAKLTAGSMFALGEVSTGLAAARTILANIVQVVAGMVVVLILFAVVLDD